jgi:hypothetical protein
MPVRNQNWYNLQATRRYPLDDKTTGEDDNGAPIRDDIIVDCHIRYPRSVGQYLFVQGINVTPSLVSVIIGAAETLNDTDCPTVAVVTIEKPAAKNVNEPVKAFVPGLNGWIVFGPGIDTNFAGRYSTPIQTFIQQRNARPYTPLPVPSIGKDAIAEYLQGVVNIVAESPVTATYHAAYALPKYDPITDTTTTVPVQAIVFNTDAPSAQFNPQTFFLAPCSQRPESGTCNKTPLERINGIEPDCETGNINLIFSGGLSGLTFAECGGIDILTRLGLTIVCDRIPDSEKTRKDDCPCTNDDGISEYCWPDNEPETECFTPDFYCATLPICESFNDCIECDTGTAARNENFTFLSGQFITSRVDAPPDCCTLHEEPGSNLSKHGVWMSTNSSGLNIALYKSCAGDWAFYRTVYTELRLRTGGLKQNGGVILNYVRVVEDGLCRTKYFAVLVDAANSELQIYRFNGVLLIKENSTPIVHTPGRWYSLSARAVPAGNSDAVIQATLKDITTGAVVAALGGYVYDYEIINGKAGLIANGSTTYFNRFEIK